MKTVRVGQKREAEEREALWLMADDEGERDGVALFALSLPWGTVSQLIPQALSMPS